MLLGFAAAAVSGWGAGQFWAYELTDQFRVAGGLLQIFGLLMTAYGLKKTRDIFIKSSVREQLAGQFKRLASAWKLEGYTLTTESGKFETTLGSSRLSVSLGADATIEERLDALEEKYDQLNQELIVARNELKSEARRLDEAVTEERRNRSEADAAIREQLESFSVGGLYLESMGLVWLIVGIMCATLPGELASLLRLL